MYDDLFDAIVVFCGVPMTSIDIFYKKRGVYL